MKNLPNLEQPTFRWYALYKVGNRVGGRPRPEGPDYWELGPEGRPPTRLGWLFAGNGLKPFPTKQNFFDQIMEKIKKDYFFEVTIEIVCLMLIMISPVNASYALRVPINTDQIKKQLDYTL